MRKCSPDVKELHESDITKLKVQKCTIVCVFQSPRRPYYSICLIVRLTLQCRFDHQIGFHVTELLAEFKAGKLQEKSAPDIASKRQQHTNKMATRTLRIGLIPGDGMPMSQYYSCELNQD